MATTLFSISNRDLHDIFKPSSPSPVPSVFIIPPEEEDSPTWCFFDANGIPPLDSLFSSAPDLEVFEGSYEILQEELETRTPRRDIPRSVISHNTAAALEQSGPRSFTNTIFHEAYLHSEDRINLNNHSKRGHSDRIGNDPEIVEVIQVRRDAQARCDTPTPSKASRTFKIHAYQFLRSLNFFAKRSSSILRVTRDMSVSGATSDVESLTSTSTRTTTHRRSTVLSSIRPTFWPHSSSSSESAHNTFQPCFSALSKLKRHSSSLSQLPEPVLQIDERESCIFLPPSSMQTKFSERTPSRMHMQPSLTLRSFENDPQLVTKVPRQDPIQPSVIPTGLSLGSGQDSRLRDFTTEHKFTVPALNQEDTSFEMRLDTLHFEAFSFDADNF